MIKGMRSLRDRRVQELVREICSTTKKAFPEAEFEVFPYPTGKGAYVYAYTLAEDDYTVMELTSNHCVDMLVHEGVFIVVVPLDLPKAAATGGKEVRSARR